MTLAELQALIGSLVNDPNHDRYSLADINLELDNSQRTWNIEAKIIKSVQTLTVVDGTNRYVLSTSFTGTPISFERVTHKGIDLEKRSKAWLDLYSGGDWETVLGTPTIYVIDAERSSIQYLYLFPIPQSGDAGAYLSVEAIIDHTPMSASTDTPFMVSTDSNYLLRPYDWGLAYSVASKLLLRDPSNENTLKSSNYAGIARNVLTDVIQVFKALEAEEPKRLFGGRYWKLGSPRFAK